MRLIRDKIMNTDAAAAAKTVMAVLDKIQHTDVNLQITSIGCLFVLICQRFDLSATDVLTAAANLMTDADTTRAEFRAAKALMQREWYE